MVLVSGMGGFSAGIRSGTTCIPTYGQVAGLEQQRLGADVVHVERRQQLPRAHHVAERYRRDPAFEQGIHQERRRPGFEPVRLEFAAAQQQQYVEGVVDFLGAARTVAVVPLPHLLPVQPAEFGREHRIQIVLGIPADR